MFGFREVGEKLNMTAEFEQYANDMIEKMLSQIRNIAIYYVSKSAFTVFSISLYLNSRFYLSEAPHGQCCGAYLLYIDILYLLWNQDDPGIKNRPL